MELLLFFDGIVRWFINDTVCFNLQNSSVSTIIIFAKTASNFHLFVDLIHSLFEVCINYT